MAESETIAELNVNDLLCELTEENGRLSKHLLFANKCLILLNKYRNYLSNFTINCNCVQNTDYKSKYYDMEDEYRTILSEIDDELNQTDDNQTDSYNTNQIQVISFDNKIKKNNTNNESSNVLLTNNNINNNSNNSNNNDNCEEDISEDVSCGFMANNGSESDNNRSVATRICFTKNTDKNKNKSINRTFQIKAIGGSNASNPASTPLPKPISYYNDYNDIQDLCHISIEEYDSSVTARPTDNSDYRTQMRTSYAQRSLMNDSYANLNKPIYCFNPKCYKNLGHIKGQPKRRHLKTEQCLELKPYMCDVSGCRMRFKSVYYLSRHAVTHTDDKPYACDFPTCSASFKSLESVSRHKKIHTQEKRFHCDFCDNKFARNSHLKEHVDCVHFNYRLFVCEICDTSFKRKTQLNKHRLKHNLNEDEIPTVEMSNEDDDDN